MADVYTRIGYIKGATGAQGAQGEKGDTGDAATIQVGSVTTVPYGQTANVVNSGTEQAAVFDFTIPQGRPGQQVTEMDNLLLNSITTSAEEFPLPAVGETGKVLWGKVVKWFSDMSALVATKLNVANVVNNLTTTASGYALDARQGKALNDAKLNASNVVNNLTTTASGYALDARQGKELSDLLNTMNIASVTRYAATITTGGTGNIVLGGVINDGLTAVVAPYVNALDVCLRSWVSPTQNAWVLTAINPNTGATVNNTSLQIRYWVIKFKQA